ncbi:MAG: hypothetical protein KDD56_09285, partial [Bdellovibrionales bacterium]|nr:hypothetical protein [Bdellovibrionales bacterium]
MVLSGFLSRLFADCFSSRLCLLLLAISLYISANIFHIDILNNSAFADDIKYQAKNSYQENNSNVLAETSPKAPWGEFSVVEEKGEYPAWAQVLLWFPNRILDAIDIFRFDVGIGASTGAVVRVTEHVQGGYREVQPGSLRLGLAGRKMPVFIEKSDEKGFLNSFQQSQERDICEGEIGVGIDIFAGVYAGICVDEVVDFVG